MLALAVLLLLTALWWRGRVPAPPTAPGPGASADATRASRPASAARPAGPEVAPVAVERARRGPAPTGVRAREAIYGADDLDRLEAALRARGATILGRIPALRLIRVRRPEGTEGLPELAEAEWADWNFLVRAPPNPLPDTVGHPTPFRAAAAAFLGAPADRSGWGRGVTVAVLDTLGGLPPGRSGQALDLLPEGARDGPYAQHGHLVADLLAGPNGLAPDVNLLAIRVLDATGEGDSFAVAAGIVEAVDRGARLINLSLGTTQDSELLRRAVAYAVRQGVVLVAAAGNDGVDQILYPAAYDPVVAVGSLDAAERRAPFSNAGPGLDWLAPGVGLAATDAAGQAVLVSGTSASTPVVTGLLASLLTQYTGLDAVSAAAFLASRPADLGTPGPDLLSGLGRPDLTQLRALGQTGRRDAALADFWVQPATPGEAATLVVTVQNRGNEALGHARVEVSLAGRPTQSFQVGSLVSGQTRAVTVPIPEAWFAAGMEIGLEAAVRLDGLPDDQPQNDRRGGSLRRPFP